MSKNNAETSNVRGNLRRVYSDTCLRVFFDRKLQMDERKIETSSNTDLKPNLDLSISRKQISVHFNCFSSRTLCYTMQQYKA